MPSIYMLSFALDFHFLMPDSGILIKSDHFYSAAFK
jgi:hypothetical protein